jgi:hypothetical protein
MKNIPGKPARDADSPAVAKRGRTGERSGRSGHRRYSASGQSGAHARTPWGEIRKLRLLAAIAPREPNALFFAGDLGQRIFQQPFSWTALGVDVRGRSQTLKVNYRTSHQIRQTADRLLPNVVRDVDGREEERFGTVSSSMGRSRS